MSSFLGLFISQMVEFNEYKTRSTAAHIFEMVTWLILKFKYLEEVT